MKTKHSNAGNAKCQTLIEICLPRMNCHLTRALHGLFWLAGHGGGDGIHHTFITLVLFD